MEHRLLARVIDCGRGGDASQAAFYTASVRCGNCGHVSEQRYRRGTPRDTTAKLCDLCGVEGVGDLVTEVPLDVAGLVEALVARLLATDAFATVATTADSLRAVVEPTARDPIEEITRLGNSTPNRNGDVFASAVEAVRRESRLQSLRMDPSEEWVRPSPVPLFTVRFWGVELPDNGHITQVVPS